MIARHLLAGVALVGLAASAHAREADLDGSPSDRGVVITAADGHQVVDEVEPAKRAVRVRSRAAVRAVSILPPLRSTDLEATPAVAVEAPAPAVAVSSSTIAAAESTVVVDAVLPPSRPGEPTETQAVADTVVPDPAAADQRLAIQLLPPARPADEAVASAPIEDRVAESESTRRAIKVAALPPARPAFPSDDPVETGSLPQPVVAAQPAPEPKSLFGSLFGSLPTLPTGPSLLSARAGTGHNGIDGMITRHAQLNEVPEDLVHRVVIRESKYNPRAIGHGGALGLMQIKHGTARALGYSGAPSGLLDAETNLTYAVKYLAGAYRTAGGNYDRAVAFYARGYYYAAKNRDVTLASVRGRRHRQIREASAQPDTDMPAPALLANAPVERTTEFK